MSKFRSLLGFAVLLVSLPWSVAAQEQANLEAGLQVARLVAEPAQLTIEAGKSTPLKVIALDAAGKPVDAVVRTVAPRGTVAIDRTSGDITGIAAGSYRITATVVLPPGADRTPISIEIPVTVTWPALSKLEITNGADRLFAGTTLAHGILATHVDGSERPSPSPQWSSSNAQIATVDAYGNVTARRPGSVSIVARLDGISATRQYTVSAFPAENLTIEVSADVVRTGDVVTLDARASSASGQAVQSLPIDWSYTFEPDDSIRAPGAAGIVRDGRFVGEVPGLYTIVASSGPIAARKVVDVRPRDVIQGVEIMGRGNVTDVHTSDLWIFEGVDGRDYAVTGTWGGNGVAYFWDVTDPGNITKVDSIQVDARTVNDVKVAPNGRYAALSREGASNRRNGVVLIDLSNPRDPEIAANYDEGLTGGVHNMFATDDYLFALSAGDKYVILDVRDVRNPTFVSEYNHPDSRIHDVWVHDGMAYSSEWGNGVVVVDVGNGKYGGSITNPRYVTNIPYPVGRTHAAFPYFQQSTGKFYLFLGDEILNRQGAAWAGTGANLREPGGLPPTTSGYYHIIDATDPLNPKDVARYEVKEYGTHNLWVENDVLYAGYYEGGMRAVDVSGELLGNLATQGREIAVFKAFDPNGYTANAPMTWGAQPYKGHVFFSDFNSGLWAVKLNPRTRPVS
jgi:hypothetical protein